MVRTRCVGTPASAKDWRASRWCSASMSTVVSTPSDRMPRSSQSPDTPVPLPISTTARASRDGGEEPQRGAAAGADRHHADLLRSRPGGGEHVVPDDVLSA